MTDTETALRQRIAELEDGLRPFAPIPDVLFAIRKYPDEADFYLSGNMWEIGPITAGDLRRAASLISDKPEPPKSNDAIMAEALRKSAKVVSEQTQQTDVERVARAISPYLMRSYSGTNPDVDDQASGRDTALYVARLAIAALSPGTDREKLREIRERHEACEADGSIHIFNPRAGQSAHADRAALLAMIGGGDE